MNAILSNIRRRFARFTHRSVDTLRVFSRLLDLLTILASIGALVVLTLCVGFDSSVVSFRSIEAPLHIFQGIFIVNILYNFIFLFRRTLQRTRLLKWIVDGAVLFTALPALAVHTSLLSLPHWMELPVISCAILGLYSAVYLCFAMIRSLGRRTNPSLILSSSFLLVIALGSLLLLLPRCTTGGISPIDSLFVSTSAVCICGLTPVDVPTTFTPLGVCIIAVMMQVGALGVMTFTSSFALFFSGNAPIYSQLMVKDMFYSRTINSLLPTLLYALGFTLTVEALGALAIYLSVESALPQLSALRRMGFAAFHSLSAFCNAGFSTLPEGMANPALLHGNQVIYMILSVLIVAGGIGFPILINSKDALFERLKRLRAQLLHRPKPPIRPHLYNMNTRVALRTSMLLFALTMLLFLILEWNHSLAGFSPYAKLVQGLFNAVTPRSAGFSSVNPANFLPVTLLWVMVMMWIGAGSQSTAGGIKVNTFAAAMLHLRAVIKGRERVTVFNRTVSAASLSRAQAVIMLSLVSYVFYAGVLLLLCPKLPPRMLLFEALSALFTVGSSLGATPLLSPAAKVLLSTAMFVGRVGLLSLLMGFADREPASGVQLPEDNLIIT